MENVIFSRPIIAGAASGELLIANEPLSFWGGYDQRTGEIIDRRHPLSGQNAAGKILGIPFTRGSSTTTAILLESVRCGTAPAALLTVRQDHFLALASIVADEMYRKPIPVFAVSETVFLNLENGSDLKIAANGEIRLRMFK